MEKTIDENSYIRAKKQVKCLKKFYHSLISYAIIISVLAVFNYWQNQWDDPWFLWIAFFWGMVLVLRAVKAFQGNLLGKSWEERKIKEFMNKK